MMTDQDLSVGSESGSTQTDSAIPAVPNDASVDSSGDVTPPKDASVTAQTPVVEPSVAPPAYQPNFKYRAFQEEKEFPEWARPLISSKEHEEHLRSLLCKADGLDGLKPKYQELRSQHQEYQTRFNTLAKYAKEDLHSFFEATGIDRQRLVDWLIKSDEVERDPQRKQMFEAQRQAQQQQQQIQQRFEAQQGQLEQVMAQNHQIQLRTVVSDPDVSAFAQAFDSKLGEGAFLAHVYNVGNSHFLETQQNMSPAEATAMVIRQYHKLVSDGGSPQAQPQMPQQGRPGVASDGMPVVAPQVKPIPSLGNGAPHTGKSKIRNLDDLYKKAEQFA